MANSASARCDLSLWRISSLSSKRIGHVPLPPYIHRDDADTDRERYQTIYSPRARLGRGTHCRPALHAGDSGQRSATAESAIALRHAACRARDIRAAARRACRRHPSPPRTLYLTRGNRPRTERRATRTPTHHRCRNHDRADPGALRLLEGEFAPHSGSTNIFISPGFQFRAVQGLLTNFHLPQSTLLMLVSAFGGTRTCPRCLSPRRRRAIPLFLLRGLHVSLLQLLSSQSTRTDRRPPTPSHPSSCSTPCPSSFRAYHAMQRQRPMSTRTGMPTAATYVFVNMINKLRKDFSPRVFRGGLRCQRARPRNERARP